MKSIIFISVLATFVAFVYSSPFPQDTSEPKKIVISGPGPGPWSIGSDQVISWWATGFTGDG